MKQKNKPVPDAMPQEGGDVGGASEDSTKYAKAIIRKSSSVDGQDPFEFLLDGLVLGRFGSAKQAMTFAGKYRHDKKKNPVSGGMVQKFEKDPRHPGTLVAKTTIKSLRVKVEEKIQAKHAPSAADIKLAEMENELVGEASEGRDAIGSGLARAKVALDSGQRHQDFKGAPPDTWD